MAMSLLQTKSRIRSVGSTKKITKAMELVATSKLKKAKDLNAKLSPYTSEVMEAISYIARNISDNDYRYLKENDSPKELYILITSSLGLCGGYNVQVLKYVQSILKENDELLLIGSKGIRYFNDKNVKIVERYHDLPSLNLKENISSTVARNILQYFDDGTYKKVNMIYTKFINSLTYEPRCITLLPLTSNNNTKKINKELLLEPSSEEVLDSLVPFYLETSIKSLMFESMLSEQASRRTAMENATDNATELEEKLTLEFNKSRQAAITQEITEISGAANATM